jgi:serine/threonine-protein kinase
VASETRRADAHVTEPAQAPTVLAAKASDVRKRVSEQGLWVRLGQLFTRRPASRREVDRTISQAVPPAAQRLTPGERIGEGGMATVEAVVDRALRRKMAMKLLQPNLQEDLRALQSFICEAQITGQLDHPNIAPIYDLGRTEDGQLFFTMRLLGGRTLADIVADQPPGDLERATLFDLLETVLRVCDALAFAHQRGVIHRDVKPENVMVADFGQVYLVDWGLAGLGRAQSGEDGGESDPVSSSFDRVWGGSVVGTPAYMSPEQAVGGDLDDRADLFSVGALLYFILTRRAPYKGETADEVLRLAVQGEPTPLEEAAKGTVVPRELVRIVKRAMAPLPGDRYQRISELKQDLVTFMRGGSLPRVRFEAGHQIIREGDVGEEAYIIVAGRCEVFKTVDGERVSIRTIGPGESFGEMAIIAPSPRTASVVALETTTVERLPRTELLEELGVTKPWVGVLLRTLAERFRDGESA